MNNKNDTKNTASQTPTIIMTRGRTTFLIGLNFAPKGKETMEDKIKDMIRKDVRNGNF